MILQDNGEVLQNSTFFEKLQNIELKIFHHVNVAENFKNVSHLLVANDAFPLRVDMSKPFRQVHLESPDKEIFNHRLSRERHVVENGFRILASRFRVYYTQINLNPKTIGKVNKLYIKLIIKNRGNSSR